MKKIFLLLILFPFILSASTKLIVLGSGTPNPDPARNGSAYAVIVNNQAYLIDFGPGIIRIAAALSPFWLHSCVALSSNPIRFPSAARIAKVADAGG